MSSTVESLLSSRPPVPKSARNNAENDANVNDSKKSARDVPESARDKIPTARSTARSNADPPATGRSDNIGNETFRSTMSTSRVHVALAALTAEKNALESRLAKIDASLELEKRKNVTKSRSLRK